MAALTAAKPSEPLIGRERPRLAPPIPARTDVQAYIEAATSAGITFRPWQVSVGRYLYALGQDVQWLYPEVAVIVARQQGKTEMIKPHIVDRLRRGRRILHAAQSLKLPQSLFLGFVVPYVEAHYPNARIRRQAGNERVEIPGGGAYMITAATGPGPRGMTVDDLIVDELREIKPEFIAAAMPTTAASINPQILYLSNAGSDASISLNAVRSRADEDPSLAWLEWSAAPDRMVDDPIGWAEANPSIGHAPMMLADLERNYRSHKLAGTLAAFETERLCRWVTTLREKLVDDLDWMHCRGPIGKPSRPALGVALDPDGRRATIVLAWHAGDKVALTIAADVTGQPIDVDSFGETLRSLELQYGAKVGYGETDGQLAKYVRKGRAESIVGRKHMNASAEFARLVAGRGLVWANADAVSDDLTWTVRKVDARDGTFEAVHAKEDRPITASLAAIRAIGALEPANRGRMVVQ